MNYIIADFTNSDPSFLVVEQLGWRFSHVEREATRWPAFDDAEAYRRFFEVHNPVVASVAKLCSVPEQHDWSAP